MIAADVELTSTSDRTKAEGKHIPHELSRRATLARLPAAW
jgi:hypothetical protein